MIHQALMSYGNKDHDMALMHCKGLQQLFPDDMKVSLLVYVKLTDIHLAMANFDQANEISQQAITHAEETFGEHDEKTNDFKEEIADVYFERGVYKNAMRIYKEIHNTQKNKTANHGFHHPSSIRIMEKMAAVQYKLCNFKDSLSRYRKVVHLCKCTLGDNDYYTLKQLCCLGVTLAVLGKEESFDKIREALNAFDRLLGTYHVETLHCYQALGEAYGHFQRFEEALATYETALPISNATYGPSHWKTMQILRAAARVESRLGRPHPAIEKYRRAAPILEQKFGAYHPDTLWLWRDMGNAYVKAQQFDDALKVYCRVRAGCDKVFGPGKQHWLTACITYDFGLLDEALGRRDSARTFYIKTLHEYEKVFDEDDFRVHDVILSLGRITLLPLDGENDAQ